MNSKGFALVLALAVMLAALSLAPNDAVVAQSADIWRAEYFGNTGLSGTPVCVGEFNYVNIAIDWGLNGPPDCSAVSKGNYSVRWTRWFSFDEGEYSFWANTNGGVRVMVDGAPIIDQWFPHQPGWLTELRPVSADRWHLVTVEYFSADGPDQIEVFWKFESGSRAPGPERRGEAAPGSPGAQPGQGAAPSGAWLSQFWNNIYLRGDPVLERTDAEINFDWGFGRPAPEVFRAYFSARFTQTVYFDAGEWEFTVRTDDGARLYIDDQLVLDKWYPQWAHTYKVRRTLTAGNHTLRLEYFEQEEVALIKLSWQQVGLPTPVPGAEITFTANPPQVAPGQCTNLSWNVQNAQTVYYENQPVQATGTRTECLTATRIFTLRVVRLDGSEETRTATVTVTGVQPPVATGDVQITLTWNNTANLDLHIVDPVGNEIYSTKPIAPNGGRLERDANNPCTVATSNPIENIYWPIGTAPSGQYGVSVHYFSPCFGEGPATYTITVRNNNQVVTTQTGVINVGQFIDVLTFVR
ncbi:MAG: hypothetical protein Kow00120_28400 [Anaerolineae bacterium]